MRTLMFLICKSPHFSFCPSHPRPYLPCILQTLAMILTTANPTPTDLYTITHGTESETILGQQVARHLV